MNVRAVLREFNVITTNHKRVQMIFRTASGSRYEVDYDKKMIRRLAGTADPTARQGKDGEWKEYADISDIEVGKGVAILWGNDVSLLPGSPEGAMKTTFTSNVSALES